MALLGDQSDGSSPLSGLLSWLPKPYDVNKAYSGLLSDPDTQSMFRARALAGVADAFAQGGMPVPYKGGIPLLSTIGHAAAAGYGAEDQLMAARLQAAQGNLYGAQAQNQLATTAANQAIIHGYANRPGGGGTGAASLPGVGTPGPGTPGERIAKGGGGPVTPTMLYSFLTDNGANKNEATAITSGMINESGGNPDQEHDREILAARGMPPGYGLFGDNGANLTAMRKFAGVGPNDPVPWQQQALFALQSLRPGGIEAKAGAQINAATNPEQLTDGQLAWLRPKDWNAGGGNRGSRLASTTDIYGNPPYVQTPPEQMYNPAAPRTQTAAATPPIDPNNPYATPVPGQPPPMGVFVPPGGKQAQPIQPPAAPPGGPAPALPGGALPPGAEGNPGPVSLLGPQGPPPGPQQAAAAPPPAGLLNPNAAAIAQGMQAAQAGALPASGNVAGPGSPSGPPPGPTPGPTPQDRAAIMGQEGGGAPPSLLQQPPPGPPAPPAAAPPAPQGPPGPPTPPPAAPGPPAPSAAPAAPPFVPPPPQMPEMPPGQQKFSNAEIAWAKQMAALFAVTGRTVPPDIAAISTLDTDMAKEAQKQSLANWYAQQQEAYKAQLDIAKAGPVAAATANASEPIKSAWALWVDQNKPMLTRPNTLTINPQNGQIYGQYEGPGPDGNMHRWLMAPGPQGGPPVKTDLGPSQIAPGTEERLKGGAQQDMKDFAEVGKNASAAANMLPQLTIMRQSAPSFYSGPGAPYVQDLNRLLVASGMSPDRANSVADYETFIKNGGQLTREAAHATSARAGVQELGMIAKSLPSPENSQLGLDRVLGEMQGMQDYQLAKQSAMMKYTQRPGNDNSGYDNRGFEADWNAKVSPYAFMFMRMTPADQQALAAKVASQGDAGKAELQRLQGQINYLKANGLGPGL